MMGVVAFRTSWQPPVLQVCLHMYYVLCVCVFFAWRYLCFGEAFRTNYRPPDLQLLLHRILCKVFSMHFRLYSFLRYILFAWEERWFGEVFRTSWRPSDLQLFLHRFVCAAFFCAIIVALFFL